MNGELPFAPPESLEGLTGRPERKFAGDRTVHRESFFRSKTGHHGNPVFFLNDVDGTVFKGMISPHLFVRKDPEKLFRPYHQPHEGTSSKTQRYQQNQKDKNP